MGCSARSIADRASHYWHTPEAGGKVDKDNPTQVGRALMQLDIELIAAYSPEARGRSERMFGTLQKRLPQELRLAGITGMDQANRFLKEVYLPLHNARFATPAEGQGSAFVPFAGALDDILCVHAERVVGNDNTVRYHGLSLQIPPDRHRHHYVKARVRVHEYPDATLALFHGPKCLARYNADGEPIDTPTPAGRVSRFDAACQSPVDKWTAAKRLTTSPQGQTHQQKRSTHMVHKPVNSKCSRQLLRPYHPNPEQPSALHMAPRCSTGHSTWRRNLRCASIRGQFVTQGRPILNGDQSQSALTWYCIRNGGTAQRHGWESGVSLDDLPRHVGAGQGDVVEVCVVENVRAVVQDKFSRAFRQRDRGLVGMEIAFRGKRVRLAPTHMLASNLRFDRALEAFLEQQGATADDFAADGSVRSFSARQYLLPGGGEGASIRLFRGGTVVAPMPSAGEDRAADLADGIGQWMVDNLSADGALPYKYWPSQGAESPADNAIRRFLATRSLAQLWESSGATRTCARQPAATCAST